LQRFPVYATLGEIVFEYLGPRPSTVEAERAAALQMRASAVSRGMVVSLFGIDIDNRYEALVDARDFAALTSFKEEKEGKRHRTRDVVFDRQRKLVRYTVRDLAKPENPAREFATPFIEGMQSLLSSFYYVRLRPLKDGDLICFPVSEDEENHQFEVLVEMREQIDSAFGRTRTVRIAPKLFGPGRFFPREGELLMWLTDDEQRIPVRLVAKTNIGTLTANLIRAEGHTEMRQRTN
jgi:hypothetical protein